MPELSRQAISELVQLGRDSAGPQAVADGTIAYAVIPSDHQVVDLTRFVYNQFNHHPHRKIVTVKVTDAASFIEYYSLFSDENSRIFADETDSTVLAVLDYHGAGPEGAPRWGDHKLQLFLRHSPEWTAWLGQDGVANKMEQVDFAEFVEDHTPDIVEPNAATMLEMARTLQAKTDVDYSSAIRTNNGQVQLTYNENVKGTYGAGKLEIPEQFVISIPVYVGTPRVRITARLRYRLRSGKLAIWYDLLRSDVIARDAFMHELEAIKTTTGRTVINGTPTK